jgi:phosphatidylinositol-3-phosphatase
MVWFRNTRKQPSQARRRGSRSTVRLGIEYLEDRAVPSANPVPAVGDVFVIDMENHNLTQPAFSNTTFTLTSSASVSTGAVYSNNSQTFTVIGSFGTTLETNGTGNPTANGTLSLLSGTGPATLTFSSFAISPQQLLNNPAAPYLNSLMTPGDPNAAQTSFASDYLNVLPNTSANIHPSEPNYIWQEAGLNGPLNDADPFPNNIVNAPSLTSLLQNAGISWKTYQEDIDLVPTSGSVNQPGANSLTSTVAPQSQWTVPLTRFSGTSASYTNAYNGSNQYDFAPKHDGSLFFTATNGSPGGTANFSPSNPEAKHYAPLQQLTTDLNNNTVAKYTLITPDQFNDMHTGLANGFTYNGTHFTGDQAGIAQGDNFLSMIIPQIMASKAYKNNGTIVVWFDESEGGNTSGFTLAEVVISPLAKGNAYNSTLQYTHSSDLKSMEELFGVYAPGGGFLGDANTAGTNDLSDLYKPGALKTSTLSGEAFIDLQGTGFLRRNDPGVSGLTVTLTGTNSVNHQAVSLTTITNQDGSYSFTDLLPGTYTITITPAGNLQNDFTTPSGTIANISVGADQTVSGLNFGFLVPSQHHHHHGGFDF